MVLTLTEDIIIQSVPEKQDENQISEKKFMSGQILNKIFLTSQNLEYNSSNASVFD